MFKTPTSRMRNSHFKRMKGPVSKIKTSKLCDTSLKTLSRYYKDLLDCLDNHHSELKKVIESIRTNLEGRFPDRHSDIEKEIENILTANTRRYRKIHDKVNQCEGLALAHSKGGEAEAYCDMVRSLGTIILSQLNRETVLMACDESLSDSTAVFNVRQCLDKLSTI